MPPCYFVDDMTSVPVLPQEIYWTIIVALTSAIVLLFTQLQKANTRYITLLEKSFAAMQGVQTSLEKLTDLTEAISDRRRGIR